MNKKGQALIEYILIIALISIVAVAAVNAVGGVVKDKITEATCAMLGQTYVAGEKAGEGVCE